jgi:hypothetical protein
MKLYMHPVSTTSRPVRLFVWPKVNDALYGVVGAVQNQLFVTISS